MTGTTTNRGYPTGWQNLDEITKGHLDDLFNDLDTALLFNRTSKSVAGAVDVTPTVAEADKPVLELTGAITADISVILPLTAGRFWLIYNNTSGDFSLTVKGATGTGVVVVRGRRAIVYTDGTNFHSALSDPWAHLSTSVAGTGDITLTQAQYDGSSLEFTGALTGNRNVILPLTAGRRWVVYNNTSGAFSLTVKGATGTGVPIGATRRWGVYTDGVNFYPEGLTPAALQTYTVTNGTTDRAFDANATTLDEIADVLATLIVDVQALKAAL